MVNANELIEFIWEQCGADLMMIDFFNWDWRRLGVTGDDCYDLINEYSKRFGVDVSEFDYAKYFYPEPSPYISMKNKIQQLTVGSLYDGIISGKLK